MMRAESRFRAQHSGAGNALLQKQRKNLRLRKSLCELVSSLR